MSMTSFLKTCCLGKWNGISFSDSTPIRVCINKRIKKNKVFNGIATTENQQWVGSMVLNFI